jgi:hypothetical protein
LFFVTCGVRFWSLLNNYFNGRRSVMKFLLLFSLLTLLIINNNVFTQSLISVDDSNIWTEAVSNPLFGGPTDGVDRGYYPFVLKVGSTYHLWYGDGTNTRHATSTSANFNSAIFPAPVCAGLPAGAYHPRVLYNASGWTVGGNFYAGPFLMYSTTGPDFVTTPRVACSADGDSWTDIGPTTGVIGPDAYYMVYNFDVLYEGGTTWKAYADNGWGWILYYTSTDGLNWTGVATNIVGPPLQAWEPGTNTSPHVVKADDYYVIFYGSGTTSNNQAVGMAMSTDGQNFTKSVANPLLSIAGAPAWRDNRTYTPYVFQDDADWKMYFTGKSTVGGNYSIGYATNGSLFQYIEDAMVVAGSSDIVDIGSGTYNISSAINLNKPNLTFKGAGSSSTIIKVSGTGERFNITAAGTTLRDLQIEKTDKVGVQNIIYIGANNVTIRDNVIFGRFVIGDGDISRAMVITGGLTGLLIDGNTIYALRQPAYLSGPTTGNITNNFVYGTKGWVLEGGAVTFSGNTWGSGAQTNVYDIAILSLAPPSAYTNIVAMSNANNEAVIEDQRVSPAVLSIAYVDASTSFSSDLGGKYHPYSSITPAITRVVAGGKINVSDGTYNEDVILPKNLNLFSVNGRTTTIVNGQTTGWGGGALRINSSNVTVGGSGKGFTFNGKSGGTSAISFACYVSGARDNIWIEENKFVAAPRNPGNNETYALLTDGGQTNQSYQNNIFDGISTPRFLVYVNGFADVGVASTNIDFIGNTFTTLAGGLTLSSSGGEVTGNHFQGTAGIGLNTSSSNVISGNFFQGTGNHLSNHTSSGVDVDAFIGANTFDRRVVIRNADAYRIETFPWGTFIVVRGNIQGSIDAASAGDSVIVAAGTYTEALDINKSVTLFGANANVNPNTGVRGAETIIDESAISTGGSTNFQLIQIISPSKVVINGFKFIDNDITATGMRHLIYVPTSATHEINYNIFSRAATTSVSSADPRAITLTPSTTGTITIDQNLFLGSSVADLFNNKGWRRGVWSDGGGIATTITDNMFKYCRSAINLDSYTSAGSITGNTFQENGTALSFGLVGAGNYTISDNTFNNAASSTVINLSGGIDPSVFFDATTNTFDGLSPNAMTLDQLFALEYRMVHRMNTGKNGFVLVKTNNVYVVPALYGKAGSIQGGVDAASSGWTVNVATGTYEEQIEINKQLNLFGQSMESTIIKSPVTLTKSFSTGPNNFPIVYVHDASGVAISDFTVDGSGRGNSNYRFIGIGYRNAGGAVSGCTIKDVRNSPIDGAQHGVGLYANADDGNARTLDANNNTIFGFQKNGTVFTGANLTVSANGNTITGAGAVNFIAQNGIQIYGAAGSASGNHVTGFSYTPASWTSTGMLIYNALGSVSVTGNTVSECQTGIYFINAQGTISQDTVTNTLAGMGDTPHWWGIVADPGIGKSRLPEVSGFDIGSVAKKGVSTNSITELTTAVNNNIMNGAGNGTGIEADALGTETLNFSANQNTVTNWGTGFVLYKESGATLNGILRKNSIFGNKYGVLDQTGVLQDAKENWWGSPSGPADSKTLPNTPNYHNPVGLGDSVSNFIDYNPWYLEEVMTNISIYTLTINAINGSVEKNPNQPTYNHGTSVQLIPKADEGYHFISWSGEIPIGHETDNPLIVTMDSNRTIAANFGKASYSLTINAMNGSVSVNPPTGPYDYGTVVTLTPIPNDRSWKFKEWGGDTTGIANPLYLIINGDKNITANFISDSSYLITYRSFTAESIAIDRDAYGRIGKYVLPQAYIVEFRCLIPNTTGQNAKKFHLHFSPLIQNRVEYPFVIEPVPSQIKFVSKSVLELSWVDGINSGDTVKIHGWGMGAKLEKVKFNWYSHPGGPHFLATFSLNKLRNPMPNRVNAVYETFRQQGFSIFNGLLVGRVRQDSLRYYGWFLATSYRDVMQTFYSRNRVHDGLPRGFDVYTINNKPLVRRQASLPSYKHNNKLLADMVALKLNITSSQLGIIPHGFGELIFDDGGTNPLNGKTIEEIAYNVDSVMMGYYNNGQHLFAGPAIFDQLDQTVNKINKAFEGPIDTLSFVSGLRYKGVHPLVDVSYLRANSHAIIKTLIPVVDDIQEQPIEYKLYQNFPNPFNPTTTIQFDLPEDGLVTLKVFNVLGQEVKTLIEREMMGSGKMEIEFLADNLTSGVYFYRISVDVISGQEEESFSKTFTSVQKMLLLK